MIMEALSYLVDLGKKFQGIQRFSIDGRNYADSEPVEIEEPLPAKVELTTLTGLGALISEANIEKFKKDEVAFHVVNEKKVELIGTKSNLWGKRTTYAVALLPQVDGFQFGKFMDHESFVIGVLSNFVPTAGDHEYLVRIASNVTAEKVRTSDDDSIAQTVGVRAGVTLKGVETLKGRVKLAPFRTFRECQQPESEFVFRVRQDKDEQVPLFALFEADGGKWKLDAVQEVARYLRVLNLGLPIVA